MIWISRRIVTEGLLLQCAPAFIVLGTTEGRVTIPRSRICRVERICSSVTVR